MNLSVKLIRRGVGAALVLVAAGGAFADRPETWFHIIGGNATREGLTADLEAIKSVGYGGIQFFHGRGDAWDGVPEQIPCLSAKWDGLVRHVATECRRLGLGFRMQNCPGWSMSGGPWIRPSEAMRKLVFAEETVTDGRVPAIAIPEECRDAASDWHDVALLAYRTPAGNGGRELVPDSVSGEGTTRVLSFRTPVTVRTVVLPWPRALTNVWAYNPATRVRIEAGTGNGWRTVRETDYPQGTWQDGVPMSVACATAEAKDWRVTLTSPHPIKLDYVRLHADRFGDNWEGRSAHVLRGDLTGAVPPVLPGEVIDRASLREVRVGGTLPDGRWTVVRVGHVNMKLVNSPAPPEATGWECDKLDPRGVEANFRGYIGRLVAGPLAGGLLRGVVVDSWECRRQTWTWRMEEYFRKANGYDLRPLLPALNGRIVGSVRETEAFLLDWRRTLSDLATRNYYGRMSELAHGAGLDIAYETAFGDATVGDILEYWKYCDTPMCEYWQPCTLAGGGVGHPNFKPVRPCVSAAHLYGKRRIAVEAFTSTALTWNENFRDLKEQAVRHYARGVTHVVTHTFTHNPHVDGRRPGTSFGAYIGTPFIRGQTWWPFMPSFLAWIADCGTFLERGMPVVDVLRYLGDDVGHRPDELEPFPSGYKNDFLNRDVLLNRLAVKDGRFVLPDGLSYARIWIPDGTKLVPETEARLADLAARGGTIVRGTAEASVAGLAPQVVTEGTGGFLWYHRVEAGLDLYFAAADEKGFRGTVRLAARTGVSSVRLDLAPFETRLLTLDGRPLPPEASRLAGPSRELTDWTLSFPAGWGAPASLGLNRLVAWKDLSGVSEEGRFFSGTATYSTRFTFAPPTSVAPRTVDPPTVDPPKVGAAPRAARLELDLGDVRDFARVILNGKEVAVLWAEPYRCDLTPFARPGANDLCVEVTSTWYNRLAWDFNRPPAERKTWTVWNIRERTPPCLRKGAQPLVSGLLGPVRLFVQTN